MSIKFPKLSAIKTLIKPAPSERPQAPRTQAQVKDGFERPAQTTGERLTGLNKQSLPPDTGLVKFMADVPEGGLKGGKLEQAPENQLIKVMADVPEGGLKGGKLEQAPENQLIKVMADVPEGELKGGKLQRAPEDQLLKVMADVPEGIGKLGEKLQPEKMLLKFRADLPEGLPSLGEIFKDLKPQFDKVRSDFPEGGVRADAPIKVKADLPES